MYEQEDRVEGNTLLFIFCLIFCLHCIKYCQLFKLRAAISFYCGNVKVISDELKSNTTINNFLEGKSFLIIV